MAAIRHHASNSETNREQEHNEERTLRHRPRTVLAQQEQACGKHDAYPCRLDLTNNIKAADQGF